MLILRDSARINRLPVVTIHDMAMADTPTGILSSYLIQYHSTLYFTMDNDTKAKSNHNKDKTNVTWSHSDESTVVHTLKKAKENGMWSDNNPKDVAWTSCVTALSGSENVSEGAPKDAKAIKWKWQCVCDNHISCPICVPSCLSLAETRIQYHQEHAQSVWMGVGP